MKHRYTTYVLLLAIAALSLSACVGDELFSESTSVVAGKPATVSFKVQIPGMMPLTRAMGIGPDDADASTVKHLWVGAYDRDGKCVEYKVFTEPDPYESLELDILSGECRIVAVANAEKIYGTTIESSGNGVKKNLLELLKEADTWEKFLKVSAVLSQSDLIVRYSASQFVMCGDMEGADGGEYVTIQPGSNTFLNPIELHRIDAHVKMNFYAGENVTIKPISFQVCNIPGVSYLYEQNRNAGDVPGTNNPNGLWDEANNSSYYHDSPVYIGSTLDPIFDDKYNTIGYTFEYFQRENKNTGTITAENIADGDYYHVREKETKGADGTNTGKYVYLPDDSHASYVVFEAELSYWCHENDKYKPVSKTEAEGKDGYYFRTANVKYTIHLGYVEGKENNLPTLTTANDFNCRRNIRYTYNIHIDGADKIRIEAQNDSELNPGAEGWVSDVRANGITLDSHYSVVNVEMSDLDRARLVWRIQSPYGDETIDLIGGYNKSVGDDSRLKGLGTIDIRTAENSTYKKALSSNQFYNWIQIRPTTASDKIAAYPGHPVYTGGFAQSGTDEKVWDLEAFTHPSMFMHTDNHILTETGRTAEDYESFLKAYLKYIDDPANNPKPEEEALSLFQKSAEQKRPYTFFIDEYVYEYDYDEGQPSMTTPAETYNNWDKYANKASRKLWLSLDEVRVSNDYESSYTRAEYAIEQQSIQTYSPYVKERAQGIGVEHVNESYVGRWPNWSSPKWTAAQNQGNGLANQRWYVTNREKPTWNLIFGEGQGGGRFRKGTTNPHDIFVKEEVFYVPDYEKEQEGSGYSSDYMRACLVRNRDLDGDGEIDENEVRWFLPTSEEYVQMMLGIRSLETPLFNVREVPKYNYLAPGFGHEGTHYAASDYKYIKTEDLLSVDELKYSVAKNLRCARRLGQDMNSKDLGTFNASTYVRRDNSHVVDVNLSSEKNYKPLTEELAAHEVSDILSFPYKAFEYASADCTIDNAKMSEDYWTKNGFTFNHDGAISGYKITYFTEKYWGNYYSDADRQKAIAGFVNTRNRWENMVNNYNICSFYFQEPNESDRGTWRMPNISELAILGYLGVLEDKTYFSCSYDYLKSAYPDQPMTWYKGTDSRVDYGEGRFYGVKKNGSDIIIGADFNSPFYIRCVRDVEPQK